MLCRGRESDPKRRHGGWGGWEGGALHAPNKTIKADGVTIQTCSTQLYLFFHAAMVLVWCLGHQGGRSTCPKSKENVVGRRPIKSCALVKRHKATQMIERIGAKSFRHCRRTKFCEQLLKLSSVLPPSRPPLHF